MTTARLVAMSAADLAAWRGDRSAAGRPLPEPVPGDRFEAHEVVVDDVAVGGVVLTWSDDGPRRCSVRELQTTLPVDAGAAWAAAVAALEEHARRGGAHHVVTAAPPASVPAFAAAGFAATMARVSKRLDPDVATELQEDRRVEVRAMDRDERERFAVEAREFLRSGMARAGVQPADARLDTLDVRLAALVDDPPADELLMVAMVEGAPVGRAWATLRSRDDGGVDFLGNTLDLFPEHRGLGLTKSFLGALRRHVRGIGVRDVHLHVYGDDTGARRTLLDNGMAVADVHLRKDL